MGYILGNNSYSIKTLLTDTLLKGERGGLQDNGLHFSQAPRKHQSRDENGTKVLGKSPTSPMSCFEGQTAYLSPTGMDFPSQ